MDPKLTILTVNYNSADFIALSLYGMQKLNKHPYDVHILDNNSPLEDYEKLQKIVEPYDNVKLERSETTTTGSHAHGEGINHLVKGVTAPYFCILDPDATWLQKDWDDTLIKQLNDTVKVVGTQAPIGTKKYQDFPLVFGALFETKIFQDLDIDCMPGDISKHQDTCYILKEKYLAAGFEGKNLEMKSTRTYKDGPLRDVVCAEYYLDQDYGRIMASHFGRGSANSGAPKYSKAMLYKIPVVGPWFLNRTVQREKDLWITTCRQIIDQEANR